MKIEVKISVLVQS